MPERLPLSRCTVSRSARRSRSSPRSRPTSLARSPVAVGEQEQGGVFVRDWEGKIVADLAGETYAGWLFVRYL